MRLIGQSIVRALTPTCLVSHSHIQITTKAGSVIAPLSMTKEIKMKKAAAKAGGANAGPKTKKHRAA